MDITELTITPVKYQDDRTPKCLAVCFVSFQAGLQLRNIRILEGKKGIFIRFPNVVSFANSEARKEASNRILATYVINHCVDDPR